jgi:hypothetical protein
VRDRAAVAKRAEDPEDPASRDRREEVLEVEPQNDCLAAVQPGVSRDRASAREALGGLMRGDVLEDLMQDPSLDLLEAGLRRLQDTG